MEDTTKQGKNANDNSTPKTRVRNITTAEMVDNLKNINAKELAEVVRRLLQDER